MSQMLTLPNNKAIDQFLKDRQNIPHLEHILDDLITRYRHLDSLNEKGRLKFGDRVTSGERADTLFREMRDLVLNYYHITVSTDPKIKLQQKRGNGLNISEEDYCEGCIHIVADREVILKTTLIHGYVHFLVEEIYGYLEEDFSCLEEGLARVISEEMGTYLKDQTGNPAYEYDLLEDALSDIWECYCWLTKLLKRNKDSSLSRRYPFELTYKEKKGLKPDEYSRGNSYFKLHSHLYPSINLPLKYLSPPSPTL
ncbi:MAG: hypothetical protein OEZ36_02035 [Spirochaetota bacterium]|nr:hypothetical protein [Spirochaetota bacterium]